ncbi:hypothetical protein [Celeribacter neptunius]|uniref:Uncharacterized protein n=1 Tax=Celeribacter neptunius TaxID=588602 RepID=A0A1I3VDV2_9RHOB|nr:hypothetical protein [Celeribacter neptunius]SFJ93445.1 hypothetical protein SAMN04487991_3325 [Celeribacter neptunius]
MSFLILAIALGIFALPLVTAPLPGAGRITASGFDGTGVVIGFVITVAVSALTSPLFGIGFVLAVLLHEYGSALACRFIGHEVARVRLVPLPYLSGPRSDRAFDHALEESFAALYAPALAIVPMVLAFGLFHALAPHAPGIANLMRILAIMLGTFNFIMLLPFLPFGGGRVVHAVSDAFWPQLSPIVTVFMSAAFASAALRDHSIAMGILAAAGFQSLLHRHRPKQARLSPNQALLVMAAYAFTLTVHFTGGYWLLTGLI